MATYQYDRCKSYQIVCKWLHTGHPKEMLALKRCTNAALTLHMMFYLKCLRSRAAKILLGTFSLGFLGKLPVCNMGVLTKMFVMGILFLKTIGVFSKENRLISLYIKREKRKFARTLSFIQSYCKFMFIWSGYSIKPKKKTIPDGGGGLHTPRLPALR